MNELNSKVYIVNESYKHKYDDAKPFGKLVRVTVGNIDVGDTRIIWDIRDVMEHFTPHDYVLLSGHALLTFYVLSEALRNTDEVKVLLWSKRDKSYRVVTISRRFWEYRQQGNETWQQGGSEKP